MDEPVADPAILMAYLVCHEARAHSTVLLSGIGGDELFAGYRKHYGHSWGTAYRRLPGLLRHGVIEPALNHLPPLRGTPLKGLARLSRKMARAGSLPPQDAFLMHSTYLNEMQKAALYSPDLLTEMHDWDPWERHRAYFARVQRSDFVNQMLYVDTRAFMASLNLNYNDKMSMASSVEVRVPFLDRELIEFAAQAVPPSLKLKGFWRPTTKYLLRRAMNGILPTEVLHQPKAGFGAPVDVWLAHDLRAMVLDLLAPQRLQQRGYFRPDTVQHMLKQHHCGIQDWSMQIWQLFTFELWVQTFLDHTRSAD
ncbi:MAG: hypothetical protein HC837_20800 [Chloroflexaceae bacterium]|nr:hypothetical protein [Chloroflexaceae bacterium]